MSSCLIEKYNGFTIISIEYKKRNKKKNFKVIDIIYKPTKNVETEPLCYFTKDIAKAYSSFHSKGKKGLTRAHKVRQCFYCNKFFISEIKQIRHVKNCAGKPGVIYNFNNQCLLSYQGNFRAKGNMPLAIHFDFETTAPTDNCLDPEQKKMFLMTWLSLSIQH